MTTPYQPTPEDIEWRDALGGCRQETLDVRLCDAVDAVSAWRVQQALAAGADVHASGDQPLRRAAVSGRCLIAGLLLDAGANLHVNDEEPLCWAARGGNAALVELFISRGADEKSYGGRRAKNWASDGRQAATLFLLEHAADIRANKAKTGKSLFEAVTELIDKGGSPPLAEITKGDAGSEVYLYLLGDAKKLDLIFEPALWAGKKNDMVQLWNKLPKKYQADVDIPAKVAALGAHKLKALKPPKLKFK